MPGSLPSLMSWSMNFRSSVSRMMVVLLAVSSLLTISSRRFLRSACIWDISVYCRYMLFRGVGKG